MKRHVIAAAALLAAATLCSLIGSEIFLHRYFRYYADYHGDADEFFWEMRFLRDPSNALDGGKMNAMHATRGWTMLPNLSMTSGTDRITTNNRGHRALPEYTYQPDKYAVVVLGDSFTFGADADDAEVWPTILQSLDKRIHIINLGVSGYGLDQMYLALRESIDQYKPQLVVMAFISGDLCRAMSGFRDYQKPRFRLPEEDGTDPHKRSKPLILTNTPIESKSKTYDRLRRKHGFPHLLVLQIVDILRRVHSVDTPEYKQEMLTLNMRIIEETIQCAHTHQAEFLLTHLSSAPYTIDSAMEDYGETFLKDFVDNHPIPYLLTRQAFLDMHQQWVPRHYRGPEAQVVAHAVWAKIQELDSWKSFLTRRAESGATP